MELPKTVKIVDAPLGKVVRVVCPDTDRIIFESRDAFSSMDGQENKALNKYIANGVKNGFTDGEFFI